MPFITSVACVAGPREGEGPLGGQFDLVYPDTLCGQTSWEKAESRMMLQAFDIALAKGGHKEADIQFLLAGDLLNQIVPSSYMARERDVPYVGLYGACATFGEGLSLAGFLLDGGFAQRVVVASSSHHDTAERQYRYPTEFGHQRVPTSQWTATAAGAAVVSREGSGPRVEAVTVGRVQDYGVTDANDMGSAMAPAFADTVQRHLKDMGRSPKDYDVILSGDLGSVGSQVAKHLLRDRGIDIESVHEDAGLLLYPMTKDICSGASGCGCSTAVFIAKFWGELASGHLGRLLLVPTGALHSPTICQQGESMVSIAHAVSLVSPWEVGK